MTLKAETRDLLLTAFATDGLTSGFWIVYGYLENRNTLDPPLILGKL